jgi:ABC-2 type transport system ATP-binding protein
VEIHRRTGYLPGDLALYERLTGRHMTDWLAALRGIDATKERDALAERFGLELDRPIRDLSKGNRQKVGLVQAFMHRPELLLLDEPTGGLDPLMQEEFRVLVRETVAAGATIFLSSHSLDEVERTASRVGVIRDGRMVTVDSVEDLQAKAKRHVLVRFTRPVAVDEFATLPGVSDASATDSEVRLSVVGSLDDVVKAAARHTVVDFVSQPADLEEIFLDVYRSEGVRDG